MCKHENQQFVGENTGPDSVNWCMDCGAIICGDDIELPKLINKPVETTNEQPKVMFPYLRRCFMGEGMISCPIISGSVQSSGYDTPVVISVRTDNPHNRTTITLNLDGTYTVGW